MSEKVNNVTEEQITAVVERVKKLQDVRKELVAQNEELSSREKDLEDAKVVYGNTSKEYASRLEFVEYSKTKIAELEKQIAELSYKQSELKPVLDELTKKFEDVFRAETTKEYHIKLSAKEKDGKKVFKQLLEYLNHNVSFTPKTAANLMMLVRNMEENKSWVNSKDFDDVIVLRSSSVLSLWRFIMEDMTGKGFFEARTFLECWVNCGQAISDAIREIQKDNAVSREVGANLNLVEEEFNRSENDLPESETLTTQEEVAPEVAE